MKSFESGRIPVPPHPSLFEPWDLPLPFEALALVGELDASAGARLIAPLTRTQRAALTAKLLSLRRAWARDWANAIDWLSSTGNSAANAPPACSQILLGLHARESWHNAGTVLALLDSTRPMTPIDSGYETVREADDEFEAMAPSIRGLADTTQSLGTALPIDVQASHWWWFCATSSATGCDCR